MSASAPSRESSALRWVGVEPFLLFTALFLILPTLYIVLGAFRAAGGGFTLEHIIGLNTPSIRNAYWVSIRISFLATCSCRWSPCQWPSSCSKAA